MPVHLAAGRLAAILQLGKVGEAPCGIGRYDFDAGCGEIGDELGVKLVGHRLHLFAGGSDQFDHRLGRGTRHACRRVAVDDELYLKERDHHLAHALGGSWLVDPDERAGIGRMIGLRREGDGIGDFRIFFRKRGAGEQDERGDRARGEHLDRHGALRLEEWRKGRGDDRPRRRHMCRFPRHSARQGMGSTRDCGRSSKGWPQSRTALLRIRYF
jgi:hypothetical protein